MRKTALKLFVCTLLLALVAAGNLYAQSGKKSGQRTKAGESRRAAASFKPDTTGFAAANRWADEQMKKLSLEERVSQLMFVRVPQNMTKKQQREFDHIIRNQKVGGICFFKGTATKQLADTKRYQRMADIPLMVTIDGEWGLGMRLTDCYSFPRQMLMGALSRDNDTLITRFGEEVGRQCRKMGIHVNFAPVADINCNPLNPVIGSRSFGENKWRVARKASLYASAMQRQGVMAVGKHFPGHGDTDVDSHLDLPVITHTKDYIDSVDLFPFQKLIRTGVRGMMVAHLQVNAYDNRHFMPSSLSDRIVLPLLRERMEYDGLVFTDGIDMKAVAKHYKDGEGAILALQAGSDIILLPIDVEKTVNAIVSHARNNKEFAKIIDDRCHRLLREKYRCGLHELDLDQLAVPSAADRKRCSQLTSLMATKALTLVRNEEYALPLGKEQAVVHVALGDCDTAITQLDSSLAGRIRRAGTVVMELHGHVEASKNYGVSKETVALVQFLSALPDVTSILVIYGSPYILESFPKSLADSIQPSAIVVAYQDMEEVVGAVPPALFGETPFEGKLPVTAGGYKEGTSLKPKPRPASRFLAVEDAGMDVDCFKRIDTIALSGIAKKAYPGCQVLVAKGGKIVYNRCYGRQTYSSQSAAMDTNTVYDLASLTKITATTLAVMKLVDAGKVKLDDPLSRYLPYLKHSNKKKITIRQALSHVARLKAFDTYWKAALDGDNLYRGSEPPEGYVAIGDNTYVRATVRDDVLRAIAKSDLQKKEGYLYSDLGFILLGDLVQQVSGQSLDLFMSKHFYKPLGMDNTTFQPLQHGIDLSRIAPTENEKIFRQQQLRGYVHDPNAAAQGGVSGHAGLFSTANDLFRLCQMMLDEGRYGDKQYVTAETFNTFNSRHYAQRNIRRALGFDKPFIKGNSTHVAPMASQRSFGHTGFTGTMIWIDPEYDLIYIFLSNRVYPESSPNKLSQLNIRTDIQEEIYRSMGVTK